MIETPKITVDAIVLDQDRFLVIRRKNPPFKEKWALPGGFMEIGECAEQAVLRELKEETGITAIDPKLVNVYSNPKRDPRGHNVSIVYECAMVEGQVAEAADDAIQVAWKEYKDLLTEGMAFDHLTIIEDFIDNYVKKAKEELSCEFGISGF